MFPHKYESINWKVRWLLSAVDAVGYVLFAPLLIYNKLFRRYDPGQVRRIGIFRLDQLGDFVISTGALREIRHRFPDAHITLIVTSPNKGLAETCPFVDEVVVYDNFFFRRLRGDRGLRLGHEVRSIAHLRNLRFDLGIDLRSDLLSIIPMFFSGARIRFARRGRGGGFLLTHVARNPRCIRSEVEKTFLIAEAVGVEVRDKSLYLPVKEEDSRFVDDYLKRKKVARDKTLVVMAPCAHWVWRAWPPGKFAELCRRLVEKFGLPILLIGTNEEGEVIRGIVEQAGKGVVNTAGEFTLAQVIALISKCGMFVGNDSGMIHIAAAFRKPQVQLFGPGPPESFGHYYDGAKVVLGPCPCQPCVQTRCLNTENWCMERIPVDEVFQACSDLIAGVSKTG